MNALRMAAAAVVTVQLVLAPVTASGQDSTGGERVFRARCGSCHGTEPGQNRAGPSLSGVIGRSAGSLEGARYSAALKDSGIVWDEQSLDAYLANPRRAVPGTTMPVGLPNAGDRAQVIAYLRTLGG